MIDTLTPYVSSLCGGLIAAAGGQVILSEQTLVPIGFYVGGILLTCGVFYTVGKMIWQAARLITNALDRLERLERSVSRVQDQCNTCRMASFTSNKQHGE